MPQLEFGTYAGQLFWLFVTFIILYAVMWKLVLPNIGGVIETRGNRIQGDLSEAEKLRDQSDAFNKEHQKLLHDSGEKARKLLDETTAKTKLAAEKQRNALIAELDKKLADAEAEIAKSRKSSERETRIMVQGLAEQIADKIMKAA